MPQTEADVLLAEDNPGDAARFSATMRRLGLYWLTINESLPQAALSPKAAQ